MPWQWNLGSDSASAALVDPPSFGSGAGGGNLSRYAVAQVQEHQPQIMKNQVSQYQENPQAEDSVAPTAAKSKWAYAMAQSDPEIRSMLLKIAAKDIEKDANDALMDEFRQFLNGQHPVNLAPVNYDLVRGPGSIERQHVMTGEVEVDAYGTQIENVKAGEQYKNWRIAPWGMKSLAYLPGVREYLQKNYKDSEDLKNKANYLAHFGPQDLKSAFDYFMIWVKGKPKQEAESLYAQQLLEVGNAYTGDWAPPDTFERNGWPTYEHLGAPPFSWHRAPMGPIPPTDWANNNAVNWMSNDNAAERLEKIQENSYYAPRSYVAPNVFGDDEFDKNMARYRAPSTSAPASDAFEEGLQELGAMLRNVDLNQTNNQIQMAKLQAKQFRKDLDERLNKVTSNLESGRQADNMQTNDAGQAPAEVVSQEERLATSSRHAEIFEEEQAGVEEQLENAGISATGAAAAAALLKETDAPPPPQVVADVATNVMGEEDNDEFVEEAAEQLKLVDAGIMSLRPHAAEENAGEFATASGIDPQTPKLRAPVTERLSAEDFVKEFAAAKEYRERKKLVNEEQLEAARAAGYIGTDPFSPRPLFSNSRGSPSTSTLQGLSRSPRTQEALSTREPYIPKQNPPAMSEKMAGKRVQRVNYKGMQ